MKRRRYRSVFISDVHLGSRGCRAEELQRFLKRIECERLYLVGDIVDFWRLRKKPYWPAEHNEVLRRILKLAHRGTRVILIPGNHDEAIRGFDEQAFGGIEIRREMVHDCLDGRRLLVAHGDEYDLVVRQARLLSLAGAWAYEILIVLDRMAHRARRRLGRPEWSLAQAIKLRVKSACTFLSRFEEALSAVASKRGLDGVVCGHVHQPAAGTLEGGAWYYNCGDWIENCSALVETNAGELVLIGRDLKPLERGLLGGGLVALETTASGGANAEVAKGRSRRRTRKDTVVEPPVEVPELDEIGEEVEDAVEEVETGGMGMAPLPAGSAPLPAMFAAMAASGDRGRTPEEERGGTGSSNAAVAIETMSSEADAAKTVGVVLRPNAGAETSAGSQSQSGPDAASADADEVARSETTRRW